MTTPTIKILRDFWLERGRTSLVVIAIALGVAAFSSVMSSYAILTRELDRGYLATNPASAIFRLDSIDDELIKTILNDPEISAAEPRRTVSGQIKSGPIQWRNIVLFVVRDYGNVQVSKLEPERGAWPPATGEILIERDAFQVAHASVGDVVIVKTANGTEQKLKISGGVHDVGQAQARMENLVYGYITLDTLKLLGEQPYLDQLNILVAHDRLDEKHIRDVATRVQTVIQARGHDVHKVDIPNPGQHPHSQIMGALLLSMSTFGLFVLLLSGILVVNLLTAMMAGQARQIAIMKAVGGSRWQLFRIYLGQASLLGAAATLLAIPIGIVGSRILCRYMSYFLNFDITSFAVPIWVYLLVVVVGVVTPLLAAAYPFWKGTRVPVRIALSNFSVTTNTFGTGWFDRLISRFGGNSRPFLIALRNSFRRRARFALTLITLSAGGLFFMAALNVRASMVNTLDQLFGSRKFDLTVVFSTPQPIEKVAEAVKKTSGVVAFEGWFVTDAAFVDDDTQPASRETHEVGGLHSGGSADDRFNVVAIPVDTKLIKFDLTSGRSFQPEDKNTIVVNDVLARKYPGFKVGETIRLRLGPGDSSWRVIGISREPFSPSVAYIPLSFVQDQHPGMTNSLRLVLDKSDSDSIDTIKAELDKNLESYGLRARASVSKADSRFGFDQHLVMIYVFLIVMSAIIAGVGGLGLMTTMSVNVLERRRELGILRAIGATPGTIGTIVVGEGLVIGILSWIVAAVGAWPVSKSTGDLIVGLLFRGGMNFVFEWRGLLIWLLASIVFSTAATFLPAWRASRLTVRESLAYE